MEAIVGGTPFAVGGPALLRARGIPEPAELTGWVAGWGGRGAAVLYLLRDDEIVGALALGGRDPARGAPKPSPGSTVSGATWS